MFFLLRLRFSFLAGDGAFFTKTDLCVWIAFSADRHASHPSVAISRLLPYKAPDETARAADVKCASVISTAVLCLRIERIRGHPGKEQSYEKMGHYSSRRCAARGRYGHCAARFLPRRQGRCCRARQFFCFTEQCFGFFLHLRRRCIRCTA